MTDEVTKRVPAEGALQITRDDLERAQAVAQVGCWRWRGGVELGEYIGSDETYRILGEYPNDDKTFEGWLSIVIPEDALLVETAWRDVLRGNSYEIDFRVIQGGQIRWLRERADPERGEAGDVIGAFGTLQDVTEKKKTVAALRASEERLRLALDAADMGVWEWNLQTGEFT